MRTTLVTLACLSIAVLGGVALAAPAKAHLESTVQSSEPATQIPQVQPRVQGRLSDASRAICESRKDTIKDIMQQAISSGERNATTFKNIYARVTEFYEAKKLRTAGYSAIAMAVQSKHQTASNAIKAAKDAPVFNCAGENPVGQADEYKMRIKAMHDSLKDYRAAVHAMLVAVKTVAQNQGGN
jgi:hypothetical protein